MSQSSPKDILHECRFKSDHFQNLHLLSKEGRIDGAPNFRQVKGFPVYGTAQPLIRGFENVLDKVNHGSETKANKVIWFNMRKEPNA
ncbi:hypothetical protein TCAL_07887 [Tigriopus californicus]|uniref:Uncharacterized protein n=1 Tax=Tigriopus californicus TaxID=6832 RepID=A0A553P856_TIGCA|nr:hypothetical protein TCAL_07887 [Tigriopus californicus]